MSAWETATLSEIAAPAPDSLVDGPFGSNLKTTEYTESGVPIIRLQNVRPGQFLHKDIKFITPRKAAELSRHSYSPGDIVMAKLGDPCGVACIVPESAGNGIVVADIVRLRVDATRVDRSYVCHYLNSPQARSQVAKFAKGSTRQRVNLSNFKQVQLPLPPLAEQRRIAAILDKAKALQAKRRLAIASANLLTQSTFAELFFSPANTSLWPVKPLAAILGFLTSGSRGWATYYKERGSLFLRIQNVGKDELKLEDMAYVQAPESAEARRTKVQPGDVLLSITADLGRTAVIPENLGPAYINQHLSILRTTAVLPDFLATFLSSPPGQSQILRRNKQGVKAGLNFDDIRSIEVPIPPLEIQQRFVAAKKNIGQLKVQLRRAEGQSRVLCDSLRHRAFRGEL